MAREPFKAETTESEITKKIATSGIRLRFDKVVLRLLDSVKAGVCQSLPLHQSIMFTVTAPIKLPAKTSVALQDWLGCLPLGDSRKRINGNDVRARKAFTTGTSRVLGFVHNPGSDAERILDLAESSLSGRLAD